MELRDESAWQAWLNEHLTPEQVAYLEREWVHSPGHFFAWLSTENPAATPEEAKAKRFALDLAWKHWVINIVELQVEMKAAARAVVRSPKSPYDVELGWSWDKKLKTHHPTSVRIVAEDQLVVTELPDIRDCIVAFMLYMHTHAPTSEFARAPRKRPAPGQSLDADFYRRLVRAYDSLVAEGRPSPARELAERMGANHGTVKSWLSRGRRYLKED